MTKQLAFYDRKHIQRMQTQQNEVAAVFDELCQSISPNLRRWTETGNKSVWVRNLSVENAIDRALANLQAAIVNNINAYQTALLTCPAEKMMIW